MLSILVWTCKNASKLPRSSRRLTWWKKRKPSLRIWKSQRTWLTTCQPWSNSWKSIPVLQEFTLESSSIQIVRLPSTQMTTLTRIGKLHKSSSSSTPTQITTSWRVQFWRLKSVLHMMSSGPNTSERTNFRWPSTRMGQRIVLKCPFSIVSSTFMSRKSWESLEWTSSECPSSAPLWQSLSSTIAVYSTNLWLNLLLTSRMWLLDRSNRMKTWNIGRHSSIPPVNMPLTRAQNLKRRRKSGLISILKSSERKRKSMWSAWTQWDRIVKFQMNRRSLP